MGKTLYLECLSGISGDMTAAALLDLGADPEVLRRALDSLPVKGFQTRISRVKKSGLDVCDFAVLLDPEHENHDHDMEYLYGHEHRAAGQSHGACGCHGHRHADEESGSHSHVDEDGIGGYSQVEGDSSCGHNHEDGGSVCSHSHADEDGCSGHRHADEDVCCGHSQVDRVGSCGHRHEDGDSCGGHSHGDESCGHSHRDDRCDHSYGDETGDGHEHGDRHGCGAHSHRDESGGGEHCHAEGHEHGGHYHSHAHRGLPEILHILAHAEITPRAREIAERIFGILADAEAKAHGVPREQVHFHEVGAVDSIVDILTVAVCLDDLDIERCVVSPLCEGSGTVRCQHGILPVPVPAVANIAAEHGLQLRFTGCPGELVTPTGAAIAAAIRTEERLPQTMVIQKIGMGAGKRETGLAGFVRAMLIEPGQE